jgi:hypothetical protein
MRQRGRHPLRGGTGPEQRAVIDRRFGARIGHTACRVDDRPAAADDGDLQPDLRPGADQLGEQGVDRRSKALLAHVR